MKLLPGVVVSAVLCLTAAALAAEKTEKAGKNDNWTVLSDGLAAWRAPTGEWFIAGDAKLDAKNDRRLEGLPGQGVLINGARGETENLVTREQWGDVEVALEFMISRGSNSGVKLQKVYEIQIADSWKAEKPRGDHCGGIYPRAEYSPRYRLIDGGTPPRTNAARPPGQWQTLEVTFRAPRFDAEGKKVANARFEKVVLNGKLIHEGVEAPHPTGHIWREPEHARGPLLLQADHGPVAFRNVRLRALEPTAAEKKD